MEKIYIAVVDRGENVEKGPRYMPIFDFTPSYHRETIERVKKAGDVVVKTGFVEFVGYKLSLDTTKEIRSKVREIIDAVNKSGILDMKKLDEYLHSE